MTKAIYAHHVETKSADDRCAFRDDIRKRGTPRDKDALELAENGYGWENIVRYTGVSASVARMLVLGIE